MAKKELRLSKEDIVGDSSPEILLEFYKGKTLQFATFLSASKKNGAYDTVNVKTDTDGDGDMDKQDEKTLLELAKAFTRFK
ncbi:MULTISPECIES: hypothetical protein [unclassified Pseudomonas]|uniref:hypothetical protein n=1 Tax=unclassified Pseudomonas TaxID=196821 RepID=UPI0011A93CB7|nr:MULTISPECIES: hypothetical protein [unclassified Pseudomonas]TWC13677.1 hypothetical protein FBY00_120107 [Pseudomonas sp. SJZ075]TWC29934.1 hypothetical protein FBY02_120107 [Pseudomonas sp. SJZ078]TWC50915.1 hypothetical protein FBY11_119107 [Pseudomonas sp. SJZ124]TWC86260.1 hypothetical protein FBY09_1198 [Pseudomonas sp. SJZ101]